MKRKIIEELIKILENSVISEIDITDFWGRRVRIKKSGTDSGYDAGSTIESVIQEKKKPERETLEEQRKKTVAIRSPIVGTFYRAPAPDAPSYVEIGDIVKPGQVVCIVEAMKLMNEIESDVAGKVIQILMQNEEPVEYNQELFIIEPL